MDTVADAIELVVSPLDDADEKALTEDSNAVECPTYWTVKWAAALLRPKCVVPVVRIMNLVGAFLMIVTSEPFEEKPLAFLMTGFALSGGVMIATNVIAVRRALVDDSGSSESDIPPPKSPAAVSFEGDDTGHETAGALQRLGYGRTLISLRNKKLLDRGATKIVPFVFFFIMLCLLNLLSTVVLLNTRSKLTGRMFTPTYGLGTWLFNVATIMISANVMVFSFHALKCASVLVGDAVIEVIHKVREFDPKDPRWQTDVVEPAIFLADTTFPTLSAGFGPVVGFSSGGLWLMSIGFLCRFLEFHGLIPAIVLVVFAFLPVVMASDIADASSLCDTLRQELNKKRLQNLDAHDQIYSLEYALDRLNK
jgi:hypothetical protein